MKSGKVKVVAPIGAQPSTIISTDVLRSALGIYNDTTFEDAHLIDILVSAEEYLEGRLLSPLQPKQIVEYWSEWHDRLDLWPRQIGEAGLGAITDVSLIAKVGVFSMDETVPPANYSVDDSGNSAALVVSQRPLQPLSTKHYRPIRAQYMYTPVVPNRVRAAIEATARAFFVTRNAGQPFPDMSLRHTLNEMLRGVMPIPLAKSAPPKRSLRFLRADRFNR